MEENMELQEIIQRRRAYRSLAPLDIHTELIRKLAEAAALSASCFNKQPWRFVFVTDATILLQLHEVMNKGNEWVQAASMIIAVVSQRDMDCIVKEREYYLFDTGMACAHLILKATELDLVAHPIAGFDEDKAKEILKIPVAMRLITLVIVGAHHLPANSLLNEKQVESEKSRPERLPLSEIMRINHY
jgi:nitroreductase